MSIDEEDDFAIDPGAGEAEAATTTKDFESPSTRRHFLDDMVKGAVRLAAGAVALGGATRMRSGSQAVAGLRDGLGVLRPPGALEEEKFLSACMRCTRCADACPVGCIELFGPEAGPLDGTPHIVSEKRACTMCGDCQKACPTEALTIVERKEDVAMGIAVVDERLCVSHNGTGVCGACHTICPLRNRAITQDFRNAPIVHESACTGCGLCEEVCIVRDRRAIRVFTERYPKPVRRRGRA